MYNGLSYNQGSKSLTDPYRKTELFDRATLPRVRPIKSELHGVVDYLIAIFLLFASMYFSLSQVSSAALVAQVAGAIILFQAMLTDYEFGVFRAWSFAGHLLIDGCLALFLLISPLLFNYLGAPASIWLPHVIAGAVLLGFAVLTEPEVQD